MKNRILSKAFMCFLVSLMLLMSFLMLAMPAKADSTEIIIDSASVDKTGILEVIGHCSAGEVGTQISFMLCPEECMDESGHLITDVPSNLQVIYIDQVSTGNNGTFLIKAKVGSKWSDTTARMAGGSSLGGYYTQILEIPDIPPGLEVVTTNSVMYGRDIFLASGGFYTPDNIAASIAYGGNGVYFKLGDKWYDLMDEKARDNSFLVAENAVSADRIEELRPRFYYSVDKKIELVWNIEGGE